MSSQADPLTSERLSDAELQANLAQAVRQFADRVTDSERPLSAFPAGSNITATDVMVTVTAMLKAVNLQVFELGMWQAWTGRQ